MKKASVEREKEVLSRFLDKENILGIGSSRIVFDYDEDKVIKIAIDSEGSYQIENEVMVYEGSNGSDYLAKIYEYGRYYIIMEKLTIHTSPDQIECDPTDDELSVALFLEDYMGDTGDNFQIGVRADGSYAAYDYGYESGNHRECVSRILQDIYYNETIKGVMDRVLVNLEYLQNT